MQPFGPRPKQRAVVFASEQLVPALQFLLHTADRLGDGLAAIHICHTDDDRRSASPARRLKSLLQRWGQGRGLGFNIVLRETEANPVGVRRTLSSWFEQHPDDAWLVNVTGGTKPMSAAAVELTMANDRLQRTVLYQEIDGLWFELLADAEGRLDMRLLQPPSPWVPPPGTLERLLPLRDRVATQFSEDHVITDQVVPQGLPLLELTDALIRHQWRWREAFAETRGAPIIATTGEGFELFLGAGLLSCGLLLGHSLKVKELQPRDKVVREVDLVAAHEGRLVCIDVKLPGTEEHAKGTQLADVAELAHSLGGRGALPVAVRPGWEEDQSLNKLAAAMGVKLLTQEQAHRLFSVLLGWIDPKRRLVPSELVLQVEQSLDAHRQRGPVLSNGQKVNQYQVSEQGFLHLPTMFEEICRRCQKAWAIAQMNQHVLFAVPKKHLLEHGHPPWEVVGPKVESVLQAHREIKVFKNDSPAWYLTMFTLKQGHKLSKLEEDMHRALTPATALFSKDIS